MASRIKSLCNYGTGRQPGNNRPVPRCHHGSWGEGHLPEDKIAFSCPHRVSRNFHQVHRETNVNTTVAGRSGIRPKAMDTLHGQSRGSEGTRRTNQDLIGPLRTAAGWWYLRENMRRITWHLHPLPRHCQGCANLTHCFKDGCLHLHPSLCEEGLLGLPLSSPLEEEAPRGMVCLGLCCPANPSVLYLIIQGMRRCCLYGQSFQNT